MEVPLDPARSARDQVAAMFKRAKRLKLGGRIAAERLAQTEAQARDVSAAIAGSKRRPRSPAIEAAAREAKARRAARRRRAPARRGRRQGARRTRAERRAPRGAPAGRRVAFRTFSARSGRRFFVGKGAADNDNPDAQGREAP